MSKTLDQDKLNFWKQQVQRFRASGCSGAEFCRREGLAAHLFHYWLRKLESSADTADSQASLASRSGSLLKSSAAARPSVATSIQSTGYGTGRGGRKLEGDCEQSAACSCAVVDSVGCTVQVTLGERCLVSIPSHCHEIIRMAIELASNSRVEISPCGEQKLAAGTFHPVVVR